MFCGFAVAGNKFDESGESDPGCKTTTRDWKRLKRPVKLRGMQSWGLFYYTSQPLVTVVYIFQEFWGHPQHRIGSFNPLLLSPVISLHFLTWTGDTYKHTMSTPGMFLAQMSGRGNGLNFKDSCMYKMYVMRHYIWPTHLLDDGFIVQSSN